MLAWTHVTFLLARAKLGWTEGTYFIHNPAVFFNLYHPAEPFFEIVFYGTLRSVAHPDLIGGGVVLHIICNEQGASQPLL